MKNQNWLPQFTNEIITNARARSNGLLDSYLIALEGWRRGLTLTWYSEKVKNNSVHAPGRLFTLSSSYKTHEFYKTTGDKVSKESLKLTGNKDLAKELFSKHGVPVPAGKRFKKDIQNEEIIFYANKLGFPLVLKPTNGYQGKGVIANIRDINHLRDSLIHVREVLNYPDVLIEQYIPGEEYRVFVVEDNVVAAINRIPANIVGDGVNTVKELIKIKNKERKKNPRLYSCLINIDYEVKSFVERSGLTFEDVPEEGERIFLRQNSNISTGGDSVDVLEELSDDIKQIAINSLKAMPELPHGGVDIIVNTNKNLKYTAYVLEINAIPQIGSLVFPMVGHARNVPAAIIDYYFPETKNNKNYNPKIYFDFKSILEPLRSKEVQEVVVTPAPLQPTFAIKYTIEGKVQDVGYRRWIRKIALESDLYGFAKNLSDGNVDVVVAGEKETVEGFKQICLEGSKNSKVTNVTGVIWNKPIKVGFEIKANQKRKSKKKTNVNEKVTRIGKMKMLIRRILKRNDFKFK